MKLFLYFVSCLFLFVSCSNESTQVVNYFTQKDSKAPVLLEVSAQSDRVMKLRFDEDVFSYGKGFENYETRFDGDCVYVTLPNSLDAGQKIILSARVRDKAGNSTGFSTPVWGYNSCPATVLINEFTVVSTERQPQRTELYVKSGGKLAGLCLYNGTPEDNSAFVILPSVDMNAQSYIVIWWTDEETFRKNFLLSSGTSCLVNGVLNVCACTTEKLSASNGVLCLAISPSPGARLMDCVFYSKMNATRNNGFGSEEVYNMAEYVKARNQWAFEETDAFYTVNIEKSTSTRSVCRKPFLDTDSKEDWFVTVTGGFTFGSENSSQEYVYE